MRCRALSNAFRLLSVRAVALRMADNVGEANGEIDKEELASALAAWTVLNEEQDYWATTFDRFNSDDSLGLDKDQVSNFLTELNGKGGEVTPAEVNWVFQRADLDHNNVVDKDEMRIAVAIWYTKVNFDQQKSKPSSSCCGRRAQTIVEQSPG